jgi:hypothetical protein
MSRKNAISDAALLLDLDEEKVEQRSAVNVRVSYGVALVAGHPISGEAGERIIAWADELRNITSGKVVLNTSTCHWTIGDIRHSEARKVTGDDLHDIKFDRLLEAIRQCRGFEMEPQRIKLSDKRDGNIVLVSQIRGTGFSDLQSALRDAGVVISQAREESFRAGYAFSTLSHLSSEVLGDLTRDEVDGLKEWIETHSQINEGIVFPVKELRVVMYCDRMLRNVMAEDEVFVLGQRTSRSGSQLREVILGAFQSSCVDLRGRTSKGWGLARVHKLTEAIVYSMRTHAEWAKEPSKAVRFSDMKTPYGVHPLWCAATVLQETRLSEVDRTDFALALLYHDLLEDTRITVDELPEGTAERVKWLVRQMTFPGGFSKEMSEVWNRDPTIRLLKLYDKVSNLLDGSWMKESKWKAYCAFTGALADDVERNFNGLNIIKIARAIAQP